jgi:hypothetical protein
MCQKIAIFVEKNAKVDCIIIKLKDLFLGFLVKSLVLFTYFNIQKRIYILFQFLIGLIFFASKNHIGNFLLKCE